MTGKWFVNLCVEDEGLQVLGGEKCGNRNVVYWVKAFEFYPESNGI